MHHYSKSERLDFRTATMVYKKNTGQNYMTDANPEIGFCLQENLVINSHQSKEGQT